MKKIGIICLVIASLPVSADMVVVETVESNGQAQQDTVKIKGDKFRTDITRQESATPFVSNIADISSGDIISLNHHSKTYVKLPASLMKTWQTFTKGDAMDAAPAEPPHLVATGKKEKVNGYDAEIYVAETPGAKFTFWVVKDYPDGAAVNGQWKKSYIMRKTGNFYPDLSKLNGVVIKSEIVFNRRSASNGIKTITTTIVSTTIQPVDDSEFQAPSDYMQAPQPVAPDIPPAASPSPTASGTKP